MEFGALGVPKDSKHEVFLRFGGGVSTFQRMSAVYALICIHGDVRSDIAMDFTRGHWCVACCLCRSRGEGRRVVRREARKAQEARGSQYRCPL